MQRVDSTVSRDLMVTSFDDTDSVISLSAERGCDHLIGILEGGNVAYHWRLLKNDEFPGAPLREDQLQSLYYDISFSTLEDRRKRAIHSAKSIRCVKWIIAIRVVTVPVLAALLDIVATIFSIARAFLRALKILGYIKKSQREKQEEATELRMRHYHYHCGRNPEGFMKLKVANFAQYAQKEIHKEAEELKKQRLLVRGEEK